MPFTLYIYIHITSATFLNHDFNHHCIEWRKLLYLNLRIQLLIVKQLLTCKSSQFHIKRLRAKNLEKRRNCRNKLPHENIEMVTLDLCSSKNNFIPITVYLTINHNIISNTIYLLYN